MKPDVAVAPNLFDAYADPTIISTLVLANLMSDRLWDLSARVPAAGDDMVSQVSAARRVVDRYFLHVTPVQTAAVYGTLHLAEEAERVGGGYVEDAAAKIVENLEYRVANGLLDADVAGLDLMRSGRFPAYGYTNLDMLHAERKSLGRVGGRPQGITSCLDEVALFAALLMTRATFPIAGFTLLSSPVHYTAFGFSATDAWWFYGKNRLYLGDDFRRMADADFGGDANRAWAHVMGGLDRITTRRGTFDLVAGTSAVPAADLMRIATAMDGFFGARLTPLADALDARIEPVASSPYDALLHQCLHMSGAAEVRAIIGAADAEPGPMRGAAQEVLLAYRSLEVDDPSTYLVASRRSPIVRDLAARVTTVADAVDLVALVTGDRPVLQDRSRVALAAETWRLRTGSDVEKAILLHSLLASRFADVETLIADGESFVQVAGTCLRAADGVEVPLPGPGSVRRRLRLPVPQQA